MKTPELKFLSPEEFINNHDYINYTEIIIAPNGYISYCVPSHQELLINICEVVQNMNRQELLNIIPIFEDVIEYSIYLSGGFIPIWNCGRYETLFITSEQQNSINLLKRNNLFSDKCMNPNYKHNYERFKTNDNFEYYKNKADLKIKNIDAHTLFNLIEQNKTTYWFENL